MLLSKSHMELVCCLSMELIISDFWNAFKARLKIFWGFPVISYFCQIQQFRLQFTHMCTPFYTLNFGVFMVINIMYFSRNVFDWFITYNQHLSVFMEVTH